MKKEIKKFILEKKYRFKEDFYYEALPFKWYGKKGEVVVFMGNNLGLAHFESLGKNRRKITMTPKEAFKYLEEV